MRVSLLLVAVLGLTTAAPQLRFSGKTYIALQEALGGRVPVSVSSANKIYHAYEYNDDHVVLLNLPGLGTASLGSGEDSLEGSYGVGGIDARVARTAATAELIEDAIDAAGDRAENEARVAAVNQAIRSGVPITVALQRGETAGEAAENAAELEATRQVLASLSRKKRQTDDDDDFQLSTADQVSFALSSLGTLFVRRD